MSLGTILLIVVVLILLGGVSPYWGHSREWGYAPMSTVGFVLLVLVLLVVFKRI